MDFLIADRTFSSLENVMKNFKFGGILKFFYKFLLFENSENSGNYLLANLPKILLCDPMDGLVMDFSSLKSDISKKYVEFKLKKLKKKSFLQYCLDKDLKNSENFIELLFLLQNSLSKNKGKILKDVKSFYYKFQNDLIKKNKNKEKKVFFVK